MKEFLSQVSHLHPELIFRGEFENSMQFSKNSKSNNIDFILQNDETQIGKHYDKHSLIFSKNDFDKIQTPDKDQMQRDLKQFFKDVYKSIDYKSLIYNGNFYLVLSNEGTGKSYCALSELGLGNIFCCSTHKRLEEIEKLMITLQKPYMIIYSNLDIILNVVYENRRGFVADQELQKDMLRIKNEYQSLYTEMVDVDHRSVKKIIDHSITELRNLQTPEEIEAYKNSLTEFERQSKSIRAFLDSSSLIDADEDRMIMDIYNSQVNQFKQKDRIFLMTTKKFEHLWPSISWLYNGFACICVQDECEQNVYNPVKIVTKQNDKNYDKKLLLALSNTYKIKNIEDPKIRQFDKLLKEKKCRSIKIESEYLEIETYKQKSVVEIRDRYWFQSKNLVNIILSTEKMSSVIMDYVSEKSGADLKKLDINHNILEPKLHYIGVEGLNSVKKSDLVLSGRDRLVFAKKLACKLFDIDDNLFFGNSMGQEFNLVNIKGINTIQENLKNSKTKKNVGIMITYPSPEEITAMKALFIPQILKSTQNLYEFFDSSNFENHIVYLLITDKIQQALGRCLGYRSTDKVENVYVIFNVPLIDKVHNNYLSDKCFTYTGMYQSKGLQLKYKNVFEFLNTLTVMLKQKNIYMGSFSDQDSEYDKKWMEFTKPFRNEEEKQNNVRLSNDCTIDCTNLLQRKIDVKLIVQIFISGLKATKRCTALTFYRVKKIIDHLKQYKDLLLNNKKFNVTTTKNKLFFYNLFNVSKFFKEQYNENTILYSTFLKI